MKCSSVARAGGGQDAAAGQRAGDQCSLIYGTQSVRTRSSTPQTFFTGHLQQFTHCGGFPNAL